VALAALSRAKSVAEASSEYHVHQTQIHRWVKQLKDSAADISAGEIKTEEAKRAKELASLHAKIGKLTVLCANVRCSIFPARACTLGQRESRSSIWF
jgi:transposase